MLSQSSSSKTGMLFILCLALTQASPLFAQCTLLVRESFRPGLRPHGNGKLRDARIHDTLKDYWPQLPAATLWMSNDQTGLTTWAFAGSSLDPAEVDPLDPDNGTAFGEAPATALLPFSPPSTSFTISAEAVMLFGSTSATYLGYTSNPALLSNFETYGSLWISLNGQGQWAIHANGAGLIASGTAPIAGTLGSGWLHMELTYDPAGAIVSGRVMDTVLPPTPVAITLPIAYVGMEAHESWNVLNNLSVLSGTRLAVSIAGASSICMGGDINLTATTNASDPSAVFWARDGVMLADGSQPDGSVISGAHSLSLNITNAGAGESGEYQCVVTNACGLSNSETQPVLVHTPVAADFDGDCHVNASDVAMLRSCVTRSGVAATAACSAEDLDHDGDVDQDDFGLLQRCYSGSGPVNPHCQD